MHDFQPIECDCWTCRIVKKALEKPKIKTQVGDFRLLTTELWGLEFEIMIAKYGKGEKVRISLTRCEIEWDVSNHFVVLVRNRLGRGQRTYYCPKGHHIKHPHLIPICRKCHPV